MYVRRVKAGEKREIMRRGLQETDTDNCVGLCEREEREYRAGEPKGHMVWGKGQGRGRQVGQEVCFKNDI